MTKDHTEGDGFVIVEQMTGEQALDLILAELPGFREYLDDKIVRPQAQGEEVLLHAAMSDLGRYYMREARSDSDLRSRYWATVEDLAASPGQYVREAVHSSLIEWFAWGSPEEKDALVDAYDLIGPETRKILGYYAGDLPRLLKRMQR